jgi:phosphotransferase system enzyme I (PtsI)
VYEEEPSEAVKRERRFEGLGVSAGIAIGPAHVVERGSIDVPEYTLAPTDVPAELVRFEAAVARSVKQLAKLRGRAETLHGAAAEELSYLLDAHLHMLQGSRLARGVEARIRETRLNAEAAVRAELIELAQAFAAIDDSYLAGRMEDVREVGNRIVRNLSRRPYQAFSALPAGAVILAEEITPADTALMDPRRIGGFASALGGPGGHTAIMARSLGLPAVLGVPELIAEAKPGDLVVIDGTRGVVVLHPAAESIGRYERQRETVLRRERQLDRLRAITAMTRDGTRIALQCNLELPQEVAVACEVGAEGIGLLRSEFLYMNREEPPGEDEQYAVLRGIVEGMGGRPVTVRTLDVGADKLAHSLGAHFATSVNPALGLRAIRLSLKVRPLIEAQIGATLRAGAHGPVRILLPMITTVGEVRAVKEIIRRVARRLARKRVPLAKPLPPLGIMIETPGAALAADALAAEVDFFSLGTNDLTMYTLAIDRGDEQVAHLYDPLHPAVLRLIQFATAAAARAGIPVNLCGEMAGNPRFTALMLGLGLRELSMAAPNLPRVKQRILGLDLAEAERRVAQVMQQADSGVIAALIDDFNALG